MWLDNLEFSGATIFIPSRDLVQRYAKDIKDNYDDISGMVTPFGLGMIRTAEIPQTWICKGSRF